MEAIKINTWLFDYIKEHPTFTGCVLDQDNNKAWYKNGEYHRVDGPALEYITGTKVWFKDGLKHKEDGPACEYSDGSVYWYLHSKPFNEESKWLAAVRLLKLERILKQIEG